MRVGIVVESLLDRLTLASGRVPVPILDAFPGIVAARCIIAGVRLGIFEALAAGDLPAEGIARLCAMEPRATAKLLDALAGMRYLRRTAGRYRLAPLARRWLLSASPSSVCAYLRFHYYQWEWVARLEDFVRTGEPVRIHAEMAPEAWEVYQRGMHEIARLTAPEVALRVRVPRGAREMLDIGGAHGASAVALCRRHPRLRATILDLPEAITHAAPILAEACLGARIQHRPGDALTADLGHERYDVIFMANLAHHFTPAQNAALMGRVARALRPDGICVIQEGLRPPATHAPGQFVALGDLFFALTSEAGLYAAEEIAGWQRAAGLRPQHVIHLLTAPGQGLQIARRLATRR
jgi:predicted O-methyltransferase YrrM